MGGSGKANEAADYDRDSFHIFPQVVFLIGVRKFILQRITFVPDKLLVAADEIIE
jgi:hypothetical protein